MIKDAWRDEAITLYKLDDAIDASRRGGGNDENVLDRYVGRIVDWHGIKTTLIVIKNGSHALPIYLMCRCGKSQRKVYMQSGLHSGAWPYAHNIYGKYLCNIRDQEYVCSDCVTKASQG